MVWFYVWDSTCHQLFRLSTFQWWGLLVSLYWSFSILSLWWKLIVWLVFINFNLIYHWCYHCCEIFCGLLHFLNQNIICCYQSYLSWWVTVHITCYPYCFPLGILKLGVWMAGSQEWDNGYENIGAIWRRWVVMSE